MVPSIKITSLPNYAHIEKAVVKLVDMGERTITCDIKIDDNYTPDFSSDWELGFMGERYIMPLRNPQASKSSDAWCISSNMVFQHWAIYWLKNRYFFEYASTEAGTPVPDKWVVPLRLNLGNFCEYLSKVCEYWFDDKISVDLNPQWAYDYEPSAMEISYSYIWDVLIKLYETYAVRWEIAVTDTGKYVIRIGYDSEDVSHIFEFGFNGGLMSLDRQTQNEDVHNKIYGRGGSQNLPYRYFKKKDPNNPSFAEDPDWIPELSDMPFSELHGKTFRDYIRGWKTNPKRQLEYKDHNGQTITLGLEFYDQDYARQSYAYEAGHRDLKFSPIEFVKDDESIAMYGELDGSLPNNDEIYPTIQGVTVDPYGRIDEVVAVGELREAENPEGASSGIVRTFSVNGTTFLPGEKRNVMHIVGKSFDVPSGMTCYLDEGIPSLKSYMTSLSTGAQIERDGCTVESYTIEIRDASGEVVKSNKLTEGGYSFDIYVSLYNTLRNIDLTVTVAFENVTLHNVDDSDTWSDTWDIWVKNIWGTSKNAGETDEQYAERVWRPILGDKDGSKAMVVFSDGWLAGSEDYEFVVAGIPVYDPKECEWTTVENGTEVVHRYTSEWKITLGKSDADFESTGEYLPSKKRKATPGNHFFFVGIDLPHQYVLWAEERLDAYKTDQLNKVKIDRPTWVVGTDKLRLFGADSTNPLIRHLKIGASVRLADKHLILSESGRPGGYINLYLQSISYTFNSPSSSDPALIPDVEIVLSNDYEVSANPVQTLSGEVASISRQVGSLSNVEQIVRKVSDVLYLRKDGISDRSISPTEFGADVSSTGFRKGMIGGRGWSVGVDEDGLSVIEIDKALIREELHVNNIVVNQTVAIGGREIATAATMVVDNVRRDPDTGGYWCYFDQKEGSLDNMFWADDVAMCEKFDSSYNQTKFYKRRVLDVTSNGVLLSDTDVNGSGTPAVGDVLVHYGSYTFKDRQYVKIRDVVGGAYERYLFDLNSVTSTGEEYLFLGKQDFQDPRFFVGLKDREYIEFKDGHMFVKGTFSVESTIGDKNIMEFLSQGVDMGVTNLVINSKNERSSSMSIIYPYTLSETLSVGTTYTVTVWGELSASVEDYILQINLSGSTHQLLESSPGVWKCTFVNDKASNKMVLTQKNNSGLYFNVHKVKLERGAVGTDWSASPMDTVYDYLTEALKQDTTISGGLILTTLLRMGYKNSDGARVTMSGISGEYDSDRKGGGIAIWAGGEMIDADEEDADTSLAAAYVVRQDGTGYMADNMVRFGKGDLELGKNLRVSDSEIYMLMSDGNIGMTIKDGKTGYADLGTLEPQRDIYRLSNLKGERHYYSPTSQSLYFYTTLDDTDVPVGGIGLGGMIKVEARFITDVTFGTGPGTIIPSNSARLLMAVIAEDGTMATEWIRVGWTSKQISSNGTYRYTAEVLKSISIQKAGNYRLVFRSIDEYSGDKSTLSKSPCSISMEVKATISNSSTRQVIIGNDSIAASYNNSLFVVSELGSALRYGDRWIRLGSDGIFINRNDGKGEVPL